MENNNLETKGFIPQLHFYIDIYYKRKSGKELKEGKNLKQKLIQGQWRNAAFWFSSPCLFMLLSSTFQDHLRRGAAPTASWALSHQSLIKKIYPQTCLQANMMGSFCQLIFPLLRYVQMEVKKTNQHSKARVH